MKEPYKYHPHNWGPLNGVGKQRCYTCGLVRLRNPLTDWCVERGCFHEDHKQYKAKVKQLGGGI